LRAGHNPLIPLKRIRRRFLLFAITNSRFLLKRVLINWIHLIDKDSHKIKELEHVLIKKAEQLFSGHARDHDRFKMNRSWSLSLCFVA
jgi:hypothetical protein